MDPDACQQRIDEALAAGDREEEAEARQDLAEWQSKGGFPPGGGR